MRRLISLVCIAFVAFAGVWFGAPAAGAAAGHCSGDVVIPIDVGLRAGPGLDAATIALASPVPPGVYRVTSYSSDSRPAPVSRIQELEQWTVTLTSSAGPVATLGPTSDLEDLVEYAAVADDLGQVTITDPVISLTVRHVVSRGGGHSVEAECVALTMVAAADPGDDDEGGGEGEPVDDPPTPDPDPGADDGDGTDGDGDDGDGDGAGEPGDGDGAGEPGDDEADGPAGVGPDPSVASPQVSSVVIVDCATGTIAISVANDGSIGAVVDIAVPRSAVAHGVDVGPGETSTTTIPLSPETENEQLAVRVIDPSTGDDLASIPVSVDCVGEAVSSAAMTIDCVSDRLLVDLTNRGGEKTVLTVLSERGSVVTAELAGGSTEQVEIAVDGRDQIVVLVLDPTGDRILDQMVGVDCGRADLSASVHVDCGAGDVIVELSNAGDLDGSATVRFGDRVIEQRVRAGSGADVSSPLAALSDDRSVSVSSGGRLIHATIVEKSCVEPGAHLDADCHTLSLRLTNEGEGTAEFGIEVLVNGVLTLERRVALTSGATRFPLPVVDNVGWRIRVTEASVDGLVEEFTGESTCREAWAEIDLDCGAGAALVRLGVEGELGARFVVLVDDVVVGGPVRLGAGTSTHRPVALDHGTELVSVYDDSRTDPLAVVDVDCALGGGSDDGLRHVAALVAALVAMSVVAVVWKGGIITRATVR